MTAKLTNYHFDTFAVIKRVRRSCPHVGRREHDNCGCSSWSASLQQHAIARTSASCYDTINGAALQLVRGFQEQSSISAHKAVHDKYSKTVSSAFHRREDSRYSYQNHSKKGNGRDRANKIYTGIKRRSSRWCEKVATNSGPKSSGRRPPIAPQHTVELFQPS